MKIAVVGGKLQGVEALYLARKAGFKTLLIDKNSDVLGRYLCDDFLHYTFRENSSTLPLIGHQLDVVIPACEDIEVLKIVEDWARKADIPYAGDLHSIKLSSSKKRSNRLFSSLNLPLPRPWPEATYPLIIKPDNASGSKGVQLIFNEKELKKHLSTLHYLENSIIQEYLEGPSYSVEVTGYPDQYVTHQITELHMDHSHDCKRVTSPSGLASEKEKILADMALEIARSINLHGIMDLEVIYSGGQFKVLEIDARLPSQTPIAVFTSSGINLVEQLVNLVTHQPQDHHVKHYLPTTVEHIHVSPGEMQFIGEGGMCCHGPLYLLKDFYGADEVLTSYPGNKDNWVATLIFSAATKEELLEKRMMCYGQIKQQAISSSMAFAL